MPAMPMSAVAMRLIVMAGIAMRRVARHSKQAKGGRGTAEDETQQAKGKGHGALLQRPGAMRSRRRADWKRARFRLAWPRTMRIAEHPSPNHDARKSAVDMLILHYTGMRDAAEALARLVLPAAKVSAHYLIDEDGALTRLVPEERRAWHAGVSLWRGRGDINSASIGIELVNPGHEWGYRRFPTAQMEALAELGHGILARHKIPTRHVLAHSDVAIGRKEDPGELFDWAWLAGQGIGLWPDFARGQRRAGDLADLRRDLARFGYACPPEDAQEADMTEAIHAFQLHFRPEQCNGVADAETLHRAAILAASCGGV